MLTSTSEPDCAHILNQHVNNLHSTTQHNRKVNTQHTMCDEPANNAAKPQNTAHPTLTARVVEWSPVRPEPNAPAAVLFKPRYCCCWGRCQLQPSPASRSPPPTRFFFDVTSPCTCEMLVSVSLVSRSIVLAAPEELCMQDEQQQRHRDGCSPRHHARVPQRCVETTQMDTTPPLLPRREMQRPLSVLDMMTSNTIVDACGCMLLSTAHLCQLLLIGTLPLCPVRRYLLLSLCFGLPQSLCLACQQEQWCVRKTTVTFVSCC